MNTEIELPASAFATSPAPSRSEKYSFFKTTDIIEAMHDKGFLVAGANQRGKSDFGQHLVRMRHHSVIDSKDLVPELVIRNSHNGQTPLTFMAGMFRMVCSNGLIVGSVDSTIKIYHHQRNTMLEVMNAADEIHEISIASLDTANAWGKIKMDADAQAHFTKLVGLMVRDDAHFFSPEKLLEARYDEEMNLWTTFNLAQESLTKGVETARGTRLRGVNGVRGNTVMNQQLWKLAEQFATA